MQKDRIRQKKSVIWIDKEKCDYVVKEQGMVPGTQ